MHNSPLKVSSPPYILFTIFTLKEGKKMWGFQQMGLAKRHLAQQEGMLFGVMLGTGKGRGFSLRPNMGQYALLTSWEKPIYANRFLENSSLLHDMHRNSKEIFTVHLLPVMSKGEWQGQNPFTPVAAFPEDYEGPIVAITRASLRWQRLLHFWKHVPGVSAATVKANGLLEQTGMGELPVVEQATLSIWENEHLLKAFAYQMKAHREVIQKTRSQKWYSEELFARFIPLKATGSWNGTNPLAGKCQEKGIGIL